MAGTSLPPSGGARPSRGRSRTKFLLFSSAVLLGLGFFGGVSATKRALNGPSWAQRLFGIELPPAEPPIASPAKPVPAATLPPVSPPAAPAPPADAHVTAIQPSSSPVPSHPASPPSANDEQGFLGRWEITDDVQPADGTPTKITSDYLFNTDGTGEFDTNGRMLYSLRWTISGEFLTLTYDTEQAPQGDSGAIRMRWSVTPDKTLLTLVPENGKDARAALSSVGPGVFHKK